jgi:quercetin dioxygenase-like cupin family protein
MGLSTARVLVWTDARAFSRAEALARLAAEGLHAFPWGNPPDDYYPVHAHAYDKVIYVVTGSIVFGLPGENRRLALHPGDRLELPAGMAHDAVVGPAGVACLEAHREAGQR